mgnify:CR=1 FL=1|tara:strand:- start:8582 stop:9010 length:429 start_codon:yes stop_codon:yes gene_type:complete
MLERIKTNLTDAILYPAVVGASTLAWAQTANAQEASDNANIRGALETNQEAMEAVDDSTFTQSGVQDASQNATNMTLYIVGFVGIVMTIFGIWALYKHYNEGEQSRDSAAKGLILCGIGGVMTIGAVMTAVVPNLLLDGADG